MSAEKRKQAFLEKAKAVHGSAYIYDEVDYQKSNIKVKIICPKHGPFMQSPAKHVAGQGCKGCFIDARTKTTDQFIAEAAAVHDSYYSYPDVEYKNNYTKVTIKCPAHGSFTQEPRVHLDGKGCPECAHERQVLTSHEFAAKANEVHGGFYDYSHVVYLGSRELITIVCPRHGPFQQIPSNHLSGSGCSKCRSSEWAESFPSRARAVHGDLYDYSKVAYSNSATPVIIVCPTHGEFLQSPDNHLAGSQCPKCSSQRRASQGRLTLVDFIARSQKAHGTIYGYSKVVYQNNSTPVTILCHLHGEFQQLPANHWKGHGCPHCAAKKQAKRRRLPASSFLRRARRVHGDKYTYDKAVYTGSLNKVTITCAIHGDFEQTAYSHWLGSDCPQCALENGASKRRTGIAEFVARATSLHNGTYTYEQVTEYINNKTKVPITCQKHGTFLQTPDGHLQGHGCPRCSPLISKPHQAIINILEKHEIGHEVNNRTLLNGLEVDVYIPSHNMAIEVNGLYYHTLHMLNGDRNYHQNKVDSARSVGVDLLHFWDYEINNKEEIVESMLLSKLRLIRRRIFARQCSIVEVSSSDFREFVNSNHIQGSVGASVRYGLSFRGELVAVMGFSRRGEDYELVRFCSTLFTTVVGGFSKLFKHFTRSVSTTKVISFSDYSYGHGNVYKANGFVNAGQNPPRLFYTDNVNLFNRRHFQRKAMLQRNPELDPSLSERAMAEQLGAFQVYGCSTIRWIINVKH